MALSVVWLIVVASFLPSLCAATEADIVPVASPQNDPDLASIALDDNALTNALNFPIEVHQVITTLEQTSGQPSTPRHIKEKQRLLETFVKPKGTLPAGHPRHRLLDALHGFSTYQDRQKAELDRLRGLYKHASKAQKSLLNRVVQYSKKFARIDHILAKNQELCNHIVKSALEFYDIPSEELDTHINDREAAGKRGDKIAVSQALKHYVRDWTETGMHERDKPFRCLIKTLEDMFQDRNVDSIPVKILLPGAGLGRLGFDIAALGGFKVTINEWSMYMNVAYRYLEANRARHGESVYPFIDGWSHHASEADMHRKLVFPDVTINASAVLMVEGDFTTAFKDQAGRYDVVLTYFFIDTARNLMTYFDTIKKVLKPGGRWINLGPLLYGTGPFVQLTLEEIVLVTEAMGFEYLDTDASCGELTFAEGKVRGMEAVYGFDDKALTKNAYNAQFWVARRGGEV
ncbi:N2227-like protein-domain-containing protein [Thelonectria olida]|uniref:N2227-like protein-domain-containing protein n=1 Tax=Thelonectria olida TaxID=1576542 RepID=A0A9P8W3D9_9HYPO|nr:N2227-like protein-domain-containing protein [Thelonectria olida]